MMISFASRLDKVGPSATFAYSAKAKQPGVINLTVGRPDYDTPQFIKDAAKKALDEGKVHYTPTKGIPELRAAITEKFEVQNEIQGIDAEKIIVTCGGKEALFDTIMALSGPGDTVAIPNPGWVSYEAMVHLAEAKPLWLPLSPKSGFIPDEEYLSRLENSNAKLLVFNSPSNPTGAVVPKKIMEKIVDICERENIWMISDEVYETLIYEGEHFSPGSVYEKVVTVNALSKAFSMTGWRLGYLGCSNQGVVNKINILHGQSVSHPTSFAQYAAVEAFSMQAWNAAQKMTEDYMKRRDYTMERLEKLDCVCEKPDGAIYVFPYFEGKDDVKLAEQLLEVGVGTVPGSPFGSNGVGCIRFSYGSASVEVLGEAFDKIEDNLA